MKILTTLIHLFVFQILTTAQPLTSISDIPCTELTKKREYRKVLSRGTLLHISCKDSTHFFFLLDNKQDTLGTLLNKNYKVVGKNLKIFSTGTKFFVVRRKHWPEKYQYDFRYNSWHFDKVVPSSWSTGNREDP